MPSRDNTEDIYIPTSIGDAWIEAARDRDRAKAECLKLIDERNRLAWILECKEKLAVAALYFALIGWILATTCGLALLLPH